MVNPIIGLTGGIASGKSLVTAYLKRQGYAVIDADQVVHQLQSKGGRLYQALVDWLGTGILMETGDLERRKLANLLFSNDVLKAKSHQLQDGIIRDELARCKEQLAQEKSVFFMDIPLLYELCYEDWFDEVWVITVDPPLQLRRLMARNQITLEEAQIRLKAQLPLSLKRDKADRIIDNNGKPEATYAQVDQALSDLGIGGSPLD